MINGKNLPTNGEIMSLNDTSQDRRDSGRPATSHGLYEYFTYEHFPFQPPEELSGATSTHSICIVGGGPVGLALALDLARDGVRSVVLEDGDALSYGSRAGCLSRRSLEILDRIGVAAPFVAQGLPWTTGRCFFGKDEVWSFSMPDDERQKFAPMLNLPQNYIESFLLEAARETGLVDIRWHSKVVGVDTSAQDCVALTVETPEGVYTTRALWVAACDGARSTVRREMGLRLVGENYQARYLIADIRLESPRPVGRLAWFNPPSNPGGTILMHKLTEDIWRFDYQLGEDEDEAIAAEPENVSARIGAHLRDIGEVGSWDLSWVSVYRANALTLERYRHGRVLFLGDAAHPIPIFGVRGLNSGLDDAHNLGWKLSAVVTGRAAPSLLDTYSDERRIATDENLMNARKSTAFMSPVSAPHIVLRDAVLSLAAAHPWLAELINPRQSAPALYPASSLTLPDTNWSRAGGPKPGLPLAECPIESTAAGPAIGFLSEGVGPHFLLLWFDRLGRFDPTLDAELAMLRTAPLPCEVLKVSGSDDADQPRGWHMVDRDWALGGLYGVHDRGIYVIRPDGYIAARWDDVDHAALGAFLTILLGNGENYESALQP